MPRLSARAWLREVAQCQSSNVRRRRQVAGQAPVQLAVAVLGLLVDQHRRRVRASRIVVDSAGQGGPGRGRLEAELGDESRSIVAVGGVVDLVPDVPDVQRAVRGVVRMNVGAEGVRAARAVGAGRVEFGDDRGQDLAVVTPAPAAPGQAVLPAPVLESPDVLVAAVPQHQAGMRAQPGDGLASLGDHLAAQRLLLGVRGAREQEVLPHQHALPIADLVEVLALVDAAAPDPDQVDVRIDGLRDALQVAVAADPRRERVVRDPVDAAGEDRHVVDRGS